jgi:aminoglycoside phosphotransferase (APT) family kinase protein
MTEAVRNSVDSSLGTPSVPSDSSHLELAVTTLDGAELVERISALPISQWPWGIPQEVRIQALRFHPEPHCTFEIDLRTQHGWHRLIGKAYATDHQDVHQIMEGLRHAGFGPEEEFSIPQPVAYLPSLRLLLQERVEGTSAKDIFTIGNARECAAAAERCGRWLGRFQTLVSPSGRTSGIERFLNSAERKCRLLCEAESAWIVKSEEVLERLRTAAAFLDASLTSAGHGDFCEHQIILANRRTVVFDWDLYDIAHPARDAAKFIVSLERLAMKHLGSIHALDGAVEEFLRAYLGSGGHPHVLAALPFYQAVFWLKGRTKVIQTRAAGWREQAEIMLRESFRSIARLVSP